MPNLPTNPRIGILCRNGKTVYYIITSDRYVEYTNLHVAEYAAEQFTKLGV